MNLIATCRQPMGDESGVVTHAPMLRWILSRNEMPCGHHSHPFGTLLHNQKSRNSRHSASGMSDMLGFRPLPHGPFQGSLIASVIRSEVHGAAVIGNGLQEFPILLSIFAEFVEYMGIHDLAGHNPVIDLSGSIPVSTLQDEISQFCVTSTLRIWIVRW